MKKYNELPLANKEQYKATSVLLALNEDEVMKMKTPYRLSDKQEIEINKLGYAIEVDNSTIDTYPNYPTIIYTKNDFLAKSQLIDVDIDFADRIASQNPNFQQKKAEMLIKIEKLKP